MTRVGSISDNSGMKKIKLWFHERVHSVAVYIFGAKTFFRYQCFCGASILKPVPEPNNLVRVDCIFCGKAYGLVWDGALQQFSIAQDFTDFQPETNKFKVRADDGSIIVSGVWILEAMKYHHAYPGSSIEQL